MAANAQVTCAIAPVTQAVQPGRYALQLAKNGGSPDLDIKVRRMLQHSPAVAWCNEQYTQTSFQSEMELLSRQQEDADPAAAWFEAAFGEVQVKAVAAVKVHVQRVKLDWKHGLTLHGLCLLRLE